ncbi:MAG TPA: DUF4389 domain-containing protein [Vicinamibacterales bacterium]|nr:DUF4389 domain-containing protein [Vicinamibacterales bacterium]
MAYPVTVRIEPLITNRNRLTVAFRIILAIPHIILVGGLGIAATNHPDSQSFGAHGGILGIAAVVLAIVSWFTLVIAGSHIPGIRHYTTFYMRWRARAVAYLMLLQDTYPPFGDAAYPVLIEVVDPPTRRRATIFFRVILAIPHFVVLALLFVAWWITAFVSWVIILFTGNYPEGLYNFGVGVLRWMLRLECYMLLLVDEYPPFSFD